MVPQKVLNISSCISLLGFIALAFLCIFLFLLALWLLVALYCYTVEAIIWFILDGRNSPGSLVDIMVPDPAIRFRLKLAMAEIGVWVSGLVDEYFGGEAAEQEEDEEKEGLCPQELPVTLPQVSYRSNGEMAETGRNQDCAICLDQFVEDDTCRTFPECNHIFHLQCIDRWLKHRLNCPICRNPAIVVYV